jgi:hypothetical protein
MGAFASASFFEMASDDIEMERTPVCSWCGGENTVGPCPWSVTCPTCQARPGARCRRPSGHPAMDLHAARIELAERDLPAALRRGQ